MLNPTLSPFRPRRGQRQKRQSPPRPTPPALTLVAAEYNHDVDRVVILTFDRAIEIGSMDGGQIVVDDGNDLGLKFKATGAATLDGPAVLRVVLEDDGDATGVETTLTAGGGNGIVAADDRAAWAGVTDLNLPFP
jgi:hypothetical protein